MNYRAIYANFIADRRLKEFALIGSGAYAERHHVMPRKLGGTDHDGNLITLTPEDHFFAHLLLAKIHGGRMWAPIAFMVGGSRKDYKPTRSRVAHGWAARALAQSLTGPGAYQFDHTVRRLHHKNGAVWVGRQSEMPAALGVSKITANMLIKGRLQSTGGWHLEGVKPRGRTGADHGMYRHQTYTFMHVDGREFVGTQWEFHKHSGRSKPASFKLCSGEFKVTAGWYLKGTTLPTTGRGAKWARLQPQNISDNV